MTLRSALFITLISASAFAESTLKRVDLQMCNSTQKCLEVKADHGEVGTFGSIYVLRNATVKGLNFDNKEISSVVVDLGAGQLIIRERKYGNFFGEWFVDMNSLATNFSGVQ